MTKFKNLFKNVIWLLFSLRGKINRKTFLVTIIVGCLISFIVNTFWQYNVILYYLQNGYSGLTNLKFFMIYNITFFIELYILYSLSIKRFIDLEREKRILYIMILLIIKLRVVTFYGTLSINIFSIAAFILGSYLILICCTKKSIQDKCKEANYTKDFWKKYLKKCYS